MRPHAGREPRSRGALPEAGEDGEKSLVMCKSTAEALALAEFMSRDDGGAHPPSTAPAT